MYLNLLARMVALAAFALACVPARAADPVANPAQAIPTDPGCPRQYTGDGGKLILYQPQVDEWKEFRHLKGRFAVAIIPTVSKKTVYGAIRVEADTTVDTEARTVGLTGFKVVEARFPAVTDDSEQKNL